MTQNRAIEFHDSVLHAVRVVGNDTVVDMTLYVHSSDGRPGVDAGTGWYQAGELLVRGVAIDPSSRASLKVDDGIVSVDAERFVNIVPLPFERTGRVTVEFRGRGEAFLARGSALRVVLKGEPGQVEQFPGSPQ